jgi:hypothetical protein
MPWEMQTSPDSTTVTVVFRGHLSSKEGQASAQAFKAAVSNRRCDVAWDLREMKGYDTEARQAWQSTVWPIRKNISKLTIIGASTLVRAGAIFLATLIGAPYEFMD